VPRRWFWPAALAAACLHAQPAFEVASIKPADPNANGTSIHSTPDRLTLENISLKDCIEQAFDVKDFSLAGPGWLDSARFNITAKASGEVPRKQLDIMLRSLLLDRFKLTFHHEWKVMPAFALRIGPKGLKLKPDSPGRSGWGNGRGRLDGIKLSMPGVADLLAEFVNRPVKDMTGASGVFTFKLRWNPEATAAGEPPPDPALPNSVFTALEEQAGLKLEARRLPVEILVVDHIERRPTAN